MRAWIAVALVVLGCGDGPAAVGPLDAAGDDATMPDAWPDGAALPDAADDAAPDAVSPDAGSASCNVEVTFAATPVGATYLNVLPLASGWGVAYVNAGQAWWAVVDASGTVGAAASLGAASAVIGARGADRVMLAVDAALRPVDLDGTVQATAATLPRAPAALYRADDSSFRAITSEVIPPPPPFRATQSMAAVYVVDRDGAIQAAGSPQQITALGIGGGVRLPTGEVALGAIQYAVVGGCAACTSGAIATVAASGTITLAPLPRGSTESAILTALTVGGDQTYVGDQRVDDSGRRTSTSWGRWGGVTLETRTAATDATFVVPVATGPRRGVRARYEGGVTPTLRAFTDDPSLVFGAECALPAAPQRLLPVDADTIMIIRDGRVWLITTP